MKKSDKPNIKKTIFQQRLIELRKAKGYKTQEIFAEIMGVGRDTVIAWENGRIDNDGILHDSISVDSLIAISDTLEVSIDYLLGRSDFTKDGNEYISSVTGLTDKGINQLRRVADHDEFLKQSNEKNKNRNDNFSVRPVHHVPRIPVINFILESKSFINLINDFIYYLDSDRYTNLLDGSFHELPTKEIIPADKDSVAGSVMIKIDSNTNKALAKNLLDIRLEKLTQEFKNR